MLYNDSKAGEDSGAAFSGAKLSDRLPVLFCLIFAAPVCAQGVSEPDLFSRIELSDCRISAGRGFPGIKARCGTFWRNENPVDADSPMLELNVAVVPALSLEPEPDPFVPIAGGPGQGSIEFYAGYAAAFEKVRRNRDILLLDQRGTGNSARMDCDTGDEIIEGQFSIEQTISDTRDCLADLPHDPRFFTTSIAVQDLEALRVALGYPKLNLYGASYGTRVAQHFLRRYPDSTRSVIIDGVVPPQLALGPAIAVEAQKALEAIFDRCAESQACDERFPDLRGTFAELRDNLARQTVEVSLPNPVTGAPESLDFGPAQMAGALRLLSYHPNTVALMPLLIEQAAEGNYGLLAAQFLSVAERMSDSLSLGMHNAVVCTEDAPFFSGEAITEEELESTYIGAIQVEALRAICSIWPAGVLDEGFKAPVMSAKPVLLLSGEADPVTPPHFAELALVDLGNARHLIGRKQGHGQAPRGCMPEIMGRFVESAVIDSLDESCFMRVFAMPFFLDFSGPSP